MDAVYNRNIAGDSWNMDPEPSRRGSDRTLFPCNECAKAIIQAGIKTIVYGCDKYGDTPAVKASKKMLDAAGVRYYQYNKTGRRIELEV